MYKSDHFEIGQPLHIPIIKDAVGNTPLDSALGLEKSDEIFKNTDKNAYTNIELASIFFESIKDYPELHSTPYIVKAIIEAVKNRLPGIGAFLDARMIPYSKRQLSNTQKKIKKSKVDYINMFGDTESYGVAKFDIAGNI